MSEKIHAMEDSLKIGECGENIIYDYLKNLENVNYIEDVRDNFGYRKLDIDFIVKMNFINEYSVEVKTDNYISPNIFFEIYSCVETNSIGCMRKTKAEYIFYYFLKSKELYILKTKQFNEWFDKNIDKFKEKSFKNKRYNPDKENKEDEYYTSKGYVIPKKYLEENFKFYKKYIL